MLKNQNPPYFDGCIRRFMYVYPPYSKSQPNFQGRLPVTGARGLKQLLTEFLGPSPDVGHADISGHETETRSSLRGLNFWHHSFPAKERRLEKTDLFLAVDACFGEKMDTFDGFSKSSFDGSNNTPGIFRMECQGCLFTFGMLQLVCRNSGKSPGFVGIGGIPLHLGQRKKLTSTVTNGLRLRGGEDSSQLYCFTWRHTREIQRSIHIHSNGIEWFMILETYRI